MASRMDQLAAVEASMLRFFAPEDYAVLGPMVAEHLATGGKRLRARLALQAAHALGCTNDAAARAWACACELMHNATLVHDDLQDGDTVRRGAPTLWVTHGAAQAINSGDLMLMAPLQVLHEAPLGDGMFRGLSQSLVAGMLQVIEGQAQECAMTARGGGSVADYTRMVRGKTAALFALPVLGAALLGGLAPRAAQDLADSFVPLGELFQMQDDVLDLWGDKGRDVVGSDVYEGKVSALVVYHLAACPEDRPYLTDLLRKSRQDTSAQEVRDVMERFVASGARTQVLERIHHLAQEATHQVDPRLAVMLTALIEQVMAPIAHVATADAGLEGAHGQRRQVAP